jgi:hypothetical protein
LLEKNGESAKYKAPLVPVEEVQVQVTSSAICSIRSSGNLAGPFQLEPAMKAPRSVGPIGLLLVAFITLSLAVPVLRAADAVPAVAKLPNVTAPVTVTDDGATWTMDNGIVKASIIKSNGNMQSLVYHGVAIVGRSNYCERVPSGRVTSPVTIEPAKNGGQRGEVAVKTTSASTSSIRALRMMNSSLVERNCGSTRPGSEARL